jgi:hypothetical protein
MKKSTIMSFIVLSVTTFVGLGLLFYQTLPVMISWESTLLITVLVVSVEAALFVLGIFVGYLYGRSVQSREDSADLGKRFRGALEFERRERVRLERNLYQAKEAMFKLKDRVAAQMARAAEGVAVVKGEEVDQMKNDLAEMSAIHGKLHSDLVRRKERVADLMADVSVAQAEALEAKDEANRLKASLSSGSTSVDLSKVDGASIKEVLEGIVVLQGVQMALVADDYGLVVEAVGDGMPKETVAAISGLIEHLGPQVKDILPMGDVASISLGDDQGLVLDTRYFDLFGVRCALALVRDEAYPYPGLAKKAIQSVVESMQE